MEINDALLQLCKSNDFNNIELAYITSVESGMISFMEFLMLLFMVRDNHVNGYFINLSAPNHYVDSVKRNKFDTLIFTSSIVFTDNGKTGKLFYQASGNHKRFDGNKGVRMDYIIHKASLTKTVDSIFKPECLVGHKKGVIKLVAFLNILTQIENKIDIIHNDFRVWLGYGDKV